MEIKKRNRAELKSYFVKNAIPTESNFSDLMDAVLVQKSDGVAKLPGDPLSVEAVGDDNSRKLALNLYRAFTDAAPAWSLELNPWSDPNNPASARAGLSFTDAGGASRMFLDATSGKLGVGTIAPSEVLHVRSDGCVGLLESTGTDAWLRLQGIDGPDYRVELTNRKGRLALWTRTHGDVLNVTRDGRVGVRHTSPLRVLHVSAGGEIALASGAVSTDSKAGLFWDGGDNYAIRRSSGAWNAPDYQQLVIDWPTGIVLQPGSGPDAGQGKSYVDIRNGKGLRVTDGGLVVGAGEPAGAKLKVAASAADFVSTTFDGTGMGELRFSGWASGYSVDALGSGKHLYFNRSAGATSNVYVGRNGYELAVLGNGNVGVGGDPGANRLRVGIGAADFFATTFTGTGMGELRVAGWTGGWNISSMSKHLYLNRESGTSSNVYVGRSGAELQVLGNGNVGVGGDPGTSRLKVVNSATDFTSTTFTDAGMGELRTSGWASGWSVSAVSRHLFLNRDAGATSNVYVGRNGAELQVLANGNVGVGGDPGTSRFKVVGATTTDAFTTQFSAAGGGELRAVAWTNGWNINAMSKHLYLNRDTADGCNVYVGRAGAELTVFANGDVAAFGRLRAPSGVDISGNVASHIDADGAFYRWGGQVYITVDDNLYIRDSNDGTVRFHFDTDRGILRQDDWAALAMGNGWVNYGDGYNDAAYYRDRQGLVRLRGLIKGGANNSVIATLPVGCRPPARELRAVLIHDNVAGRVDVLPGGQVIAMDVSATWLSLDGISFRAAL
jgi:hypothetical protein